MGVHCHYHHWALRRPSKANLDVELLIWLPLIIVDNLHLVLELGLPRLKSDHVVHLGNNNIL